MIKAVKGMSDIYYPEVEIWEYLEEVLKDIATKYNYKEIRTPIIEEAALFSRSVGKATDIVEKEMYTFLDKKERELVLRPEGTASVCRAFIENGFLKALKPVKFFYIGPFFRYERPQAGRKRQFHQFGIEALGDKSPLLDLETIEVSFEILNRFGLNDLEVHINSIGCEKCRPKYKSLLKKELDLHYNELCDDCKRRKDENPLRVLDCKKEREELLSILPKNKDYLCEECKDHFENLKNLLKKEKIPFKINDRLVRGLDYYTKTVYEVISKDLGAQNSLLGGGRYDNLIKELGGDDTPGVGFAMGLERLIMILEKKEIKEYKKEKSFYISYFKEISLEKALEIRKKLISSGNIAEIDLKGDSISKQISRASKLNFDYVIMIGEEELKSSTLKIKNLKTGEQKNIKEEGFENIIKVL